MGATASVPTDPRRTPEVICVGYQRTGTFSTSLALERLGYGPVAHGGTQFIRREDAYVRDLLALYDTPATDRPRLLAAVHKVTVGFGAICDAPYNLYAGEMAELYPAAKFVWLDREPEKWWPSFKPVADSATPAWLAVFFSIIPGWRWLPGVVAGMNRRFVATFPVPCCNHALHGPFCLKCLMTSGG